MQTIVSQLEKIFRAAIAAAFDLDADPLLAVAQNEKHGDYQSNAAMGLAKVVSEKTGQKTNPRAVAEQIKAKLDLSAMAQDVSIAGPGFVNVRLSPAWLAQQLRSIAADERLGVEKEAHPQTVVVDYSGPNIAKQMHVGHLRSTIIGDAVARSLQFAGHNVIRQNHLGDWGTQFGRVVLAMWYEAVFLRSGQLPKLRELVERQQAAAWKLAQDKETGLNGKPDFEASINAIARDIAPLHQQFVNEDPDGSKYFLPYLNENQIELDELERAYVFVSAITDTPQAAVTHIVHARYGSKSLADLPRLTTTFIQKPQDPANQQERLAWEKARAVTLEACNEIYRQLNVQLADPSIQREPLERGESFYNPLLADVVKTLLEKRIAIESKGAVVIEVPGFESPLIIEKGAGGYLYGTTDLAAVRFRATQLHANRVLYFVDARQSQHFAQVFWTAQKAGWADGVSLEHAAFGTILGKDGKPFKTRSGDIVKLKDLLDEGEQRAVTVVTEKNPDLPAAKRTEIAHAVGIGAVKYADLSKDRTSDYIFDWDSMLSFDGNTAPYLQNAYVRVHGIFRKAKERGIDRKPAAASEIRIEAPHEAALAKQILRLGEIVSLVCRELKPHHLCAYLYELATRFHAFFEHCPVLPAEGVTRESRLALCELTARALGLGLDLLGIEHPEQM
jgi:arginyl-tRNA synthetase